MTDNNIVTLSEAEPEQDIAALRTAVAERNQANINRLAQMGAAPPLVIVLKERLDFLTEVMVDVLQIDQDKLELAWEEFFGAFLDRALDAAPKALLLEGVQP